MKTSVIEIEIHDDIGSLKDKILWSQSNRILLVASPHTKLLQRKIDQLLLKRHTNQLGAQLAFVTFHADTIQIANDLKIPVFPSIRKAQYENWHADQRTKNDIFLHRTHKNISRSPGFRKIHSDYTNNRLSLVIFFIGVSVPILLALCLTPKAKIIIPSDTELQKEVMQLSVSSLPDGYYLAIQAQILTETIEESITAPASGKITISDKAATGIVHFTNLTENAILIPKGTIVRTGEPEKIEFFSMIDTLVTGGAGESSDCPVQAVLPGESGNITSQTIRFLEGPLSTEIKVTNLKPMAGGTIIAINSVSQEDLANARSQLGAKLTQSASKVFEEQAAEKTQLLPSTLSMQSEIESFTPGLDQPADYFVYSLKGTFTIWSYSKDDFVNLVNKFMDTTLESGFSADPESLKFPYINQITNTTNQNIELRFEATRKIWKDLNEVILNLDLAGLPKLKAVNQIEKILEFKKKPKIEISPSWWQWMPLLPARISVGYQE